MNIRNRKISLTDPFESTLNLNKFSSSVELTATRVFDFIHQKIENKGVEPMVLIELMKKSDWDNGSLWNKKALTSSVN